MTFRRFASLTAATASRLYGGSSTEAAAVRDAWAEVGLKTGAKVMGAGG